MVIMEHTQDWYARFTDYWNAMKQISYLNRQGEIIIPDETHEDELDAIAREYEIETINEIIYL